MAGHIFISYSKKDASFAFKLAQDLETRGFKIWIDREIGGGEHWRTSISQALHEASEMIVVLSPNAIQSEWVMHEGSVGSGLEKRIYPVLLEPIPRLPIWMEELQYIDFVKNDYDTALGLLTQALMPPNPLQDLLDQQVQAYKQTNELIGEALLRVLDEGRDKLNITPEAAALIERSKRAITYRRRLLQGGAGLLAVLVVVAIISTVMAIGANSTALNSQNALATVRAGAEVAVTAAAEASFRIGIADRLFELLYDQIGTIVVGDGPRALAWYDTGLWVANLRDDTVMQVDLRSGAPLVKDINVVTVGDAPTALAWTGTSLWVANKNGDSVMEIDPITHLVVATIPVDDEPTALAWDGNSLWVSSRGNDTVQQIDPQNHRVIGTIPVDNDPTSSAAPAALLWDGTNNRLWVANQGADTVQLINRAGRAIERTFPVGDAPTALAWDGRNLWVCNSGVYSAIQRIDPEAGAVGSPIAVGTFPTALLWDGSVLWVANSRDNNVMRFRPIDDTGETWAQDGDPIEVGENPRALAWGIQDLWVADADDAAVVRVDVDALGGATPTPSPEANE